jgi:hypothetical protein
MFDLGESRWVRADLATDDLATEALGTEVLGTEVLGTEVFGTEAFVVALFFDPDDLAKYDERLPP